MKKSHDVTRRSDRARGRPFEFEYQHRFVSHASRSAQDRFDGGVDRLDDAEPNGMVAVGGDPFDVCEEELAQPVHFGKPLPPQRVDPAIEEIQHPGSRLVRPEAIELFP